ncbi:inner membrane protein YbiR [bacterium BMS3Abin04]|nr:inner membrane protein YbiR [bacterium BMS3Abin04]
MKFQSELLKFFLKEWLLIASAVGFALTSIYTQHLPVYSLQEMQILFILFVLFISVKGLEHSGFFLKLSQSIEKGKFIPLKLIIATFFLSMIITNDITLIVIVPLTLSLSVNRRDILVILEALAANAGSALTPFGNPQNLFIYWFYNLSPTQFVSSIIPFSFVFLCLLVISSFIVKSKSNSHYPSKLRKVENSAYIYGLLLIIVLLTVLRILPVLAGLLVIFYALLFDRKSMRVDYALLLSFFFFFGLAENMKLILVTEISHSEHVFIFSALASQIMSNVPTALLFAKFTARWKALLWGTNVGGFGSLLGSLANLIAYKLYITHENTNNSTSFTLKFLTIGYLAFSIGIGLYFILEKM